MPRLAIKDEDELTAGTGVEGRRQKKSGVNLDDITTQKSRKIQSFGGLNFDKKKQADIFESEPR
ncbi:MAG: hypothetical protein Q7J09_09885 [Methanocalculus sp.]|uniref:hypothetical protein n=1 Tax=Methanocalculus sp. TaxID=2004547 RepID=UPI00271654DC|nr:hypothetical protein [Methanocalculus sp.]MDO8842135.1 hypothetical protein [Methanocalculus sp.]MDO9540293.1 hypothetical protein [Methanocalculus sp.]